MKKIEENGIEHDFETLDQVFASVDGGAMVHWRTKAYLVKRGWGGFVVQATFNGHSIGITDDFKAEDFFRSNAI